MGDPSLALQVALFARLETELTCPVFDGAPMDQAKPYVSFDSEIAVPSDILAKRRDTRFFYLTVWSDFKGQEEVKRIMGEIDAAVHQRALPLEHGRVISIRIERKQAQRDADGVTYQGSVTLRVLTEH